VRDLLHRASFVFLSSIFGIQEVVASGS